MSFGERLRAARKHCGYTQEQLAKKCNLSTGTIQRYELNTRNPKKSTVAQIADALNLGYSFTRTGEAYFYDFVDVVESPQSENNVFNKTQLSNAGKTERIVSAFNKLNDEGQEQAIVVVDAFTEIPRFQRRPPVEIDLDHEET